MDSGTFPCGVSAAVYPVCGRCLREAHACVCRSLLTLLAITTIALGVVVVLLALGMGLASTERLGGHPRSVSTRAGAQEAQL